MLACIHVPIHTYTHVVYFYAYSFPAVILSWLVDKEVAAKAIRQDFLIDEDEVECRPERVPDSIIDENVDVFLVRKMFTQNAWAMVEDVYKQKVKKMNWICSVCYHDLNDAQSIACDSCLLWYHFMCCGVTKQPKTTTWFCRKCFADAKRKCTDE